MVRHAIRQMSRSVSKRRWALTITRRNVNITREHHPSQREHHPSQREHHPSQREHHPSQREHHPSQRERLPAHSGSSHVASSHGPITCRFITRPHHARPPSNTASQKRPLKLTPPFTPRQPRYMPCHHALIASPPDHPASPAPCLSPPPFGAPSAPIRGGHGVRRGPSPL